MLNFFPSKISKKLPLALIGVGVLVGLGVGTAAFFVAADTIDNASEERLEAVAYQRSDSVETLFTNIEQDIIVTANSPLIADTIVDFTNAWNALEGNQRELLQAAYIEDNPFPAGEKHKLDSAESASDYDKLHARVHTVFRTQMEQREYYDIFLFDNAGNLIYSVFKELDYATNFLAGGGAWADTDLGEVFRSASQLPAGETTFTDFTPYAPSYDAPASFMAAPVFDDAQRRVGVVALQMPISRINEMMNDRHGLGETGETYLVGTDGLLRNDSYRTSEGDILARAAHTTSLEKGLSAIDNVFIAPGLLGDQSLIATHQATFGNTKWIVIAEQELSEVKAPLNHMLTTTSLIGGLLIAFSTLGAFWFSRSLTKPITRMSNLMGEIADNQFDVEVEGQSRRDELGDMARAVEVFRENGLRVAEMTEEEAARLERNRVERAEMMQELQRAFGDVVDAAVAGDFSKRVTSEFPDAELNQLAASVNNLVETVDTGMGETGGVLSALADMNLTERVNGDYQGAFAKLKDDTNAVADKLSDVVGQLRETSQGVKSATGEILAGANDLSERTTKQAATIEETSAAMEQLATTVGESAKKADDASAKSQTVSQTAAEGGEVMHQANEAMERITSSSTKISNIIGMIDDIAFQTNLLALNASVEAARAGEAGKGFAVVAIEVRRLAQSAADASSEVKQLIEQSSTEVSDGSQLVAAAAEKLESMLGAVKENASLMGSIAQESREQASSIEEVNTAVRQMDEMTQHNAALVEQTNAAIEQTEAQATELDRIVDVFRIKEGNTRSASRSSRPPTAKPQASATAKSAYLSNGNAAIDKEWAEF